ncbi:ATP-binding protein [Streptomyces sp. NRRL S-31]|uniref:ATP-binding protein n=1 Tax=Streptomyces sp. NRRL S-31 TaxID=1463898 RepID=UPI0005651D81|nr:ATP-binding protein [Streptomyces sp. NRRL S-31]
MLTSLEFRLLATAKAAPELRHRLRDHGHDVRLCATELLTNVIDHLGEGTPVTVRVIGTAAEHGRVRVEVTDPAPDSPPVLRSAAGWEESGRGLALVDALAERWGVDVGPDRKTVWCELVGDGRADGRPVSGAARPTAPARGR